MTNLIQSFSVDYSRTSELNARVPSSDNSAIRAAQKVFIAAKTALMAVAETFLNLAKIVANLGISLVNRVHSLFTKKEELKTEQQVQQVTLMQKAKNLGSRVLNGTKGLLSSSASKVASGATASVQFAKDHKKAIGATVALAGFGAAGYYYGPELASRIKNNFAKTETLTSGQQTCPATPSSLPTAAGICEAPLNTTRFSHQGSCNIPTPVTDTCQAPQNFSIPAQTSSNLSRIDIACLKNGTCQRVIRRELPVTLNNQNLMRTISSISNGLLKVKEALVLTAKDLTNKALSLIGNFQNESASLLKDASTVSTTNQSGTTQAAKIIYPPQGFSNSSRPLTCIQT